MEQIIEEQTINFENVKEEPTYLRKDAVRGAGGMIFDFVRGIKKLMISPRTGKQYEEIELTLKDDYGEKKLRCFMNNLDFQKKNPKKVRVTVEQQDKFLNWKVSRIE